VIALVCLAREESGCRTLATLTVISSPEQCISDDITATSLTDDDVL
jgi:hypothetical protein